MGIFVEHEACPKCGSRDNLGRYDDGSAWCFGCHYHESATHAPMRHMGSIGGKIEKYHHALPEDASTHYGQSAVEWLASFHLDVPTAIRREVVWSPSREQLIFKLGNCWQARNFNEERKKKGKNFTSGDVNECLHIYTGQSDGQPLRLVLVEDPVSAIRIAESGGTSDALPLLGSHLATARLNAVARLYTDLVFWLDSDKYKEAQAMADKARYMGLSTRVVWTELDPKCYTNKQLMEILQ